MINEIKKYLEENYHIGFIVKGDKANFKITLKDSDCDKFYVRIINKDGVRLQIIAEPETHGAEFLRLLSNSGEEKRILCSELIDHRLKGITNVIVNKRKLSADEFINNTEKWLSFSIIYEEFPFDNSSETIIKVVTMLCGMFLSLINYDVEGFEEGNKQTVISAKYERNPINRKICLNAKGYKCVICGFDFEEKYGKIGKQTIEVHHTTPVSKMGLGYVVNPIKELVPVCSNCHTIIHKRKEPYTIEEVKDMINRKKDF